MTIDHPAPEQVPQLLELWKGAFGEYNGFWELFLETAFSPRRCRCLLERDRVAASLCWLEGQLEGQKMAYVYAVVTDPAFRGQGLCRRLMEDTHRHLALAGYAAVLLVPAEEGLRAMYRKLGYRDCTAVREFSCGASGAPAELRAIGPEEFARLRREYLPAGGLIQEGENLTFLARQAEFFIGGDFLLTAYREGDTLHAMELLGDPQAAPGILKTLNCCKGDFRCPGQEKPFAMVYPLAENAAIPQYFGFAFD